jgi:hypothetical protein
MTDMTCRYAGDREAIVVSYLYNDIDPTERGAFDAHLASCAICREEVASLIGVRDRLGAWSPPALDARSPSARSSQPSASTWRTVPVWAQVAAAMLVVGVAAGIANLDVHYDRTGLTVRTGWSKAPSSAAVPQDSGTLRWRAELAAAEDRLRTELRSSAAPAEQPARSPALADADLMRRVQSLMDESEKRQQRELALRVADVMRDVETERRADLVKIDRSLGMLQSNTGVEVMRNRQMLDYLVRVSQNK